MSLDFYLTASVDTGGERQHEITLFDANATHNLTPMWRLAGCYDALYESHGKPAGEVLPALHNALTDMRTRPETYRPLNPSNGWGDYAGALRFLENVVAACREHPKAVIRVSR